MSSLHRFHLASWIAGVVLVAACVPDASASLAGTIDPRERLAGVATDLYGDVRAPEPVPAPVAPPRVMSHPACAGTPGNLLSNCSFETGDFSGWTAVNMANPYCGPLAVQPHGFCGCEFCTTAMDGNYSVYHGFDGGGPDEFEVSQAVTLCGGQATLAFDWRAYTDHFGIVRTFDVIVEQPPGTVAYTENVYTTSAAGHEDTGLRTSQVQFSALTGPAVVRFRWLIPESFTGPGQFQFDNVTLTCATLVDLGPIEAKLDDETRFTDDAELSAQTTVILSALAATDAATDAIEGKLDDATRYTSDAELSASQSVQTTTILDAFAARDAATNAIEGKLDDATRYTSDAELTALRGVLLAGIDANGAAIDGVEAKLDDEARFTDDAELAAAVAIFADVADGVDGVETKLDDESRYADDVELEAARQSLADAIAASELKIDVLEAKLDELASGDEMLRIEIEKSLLLNDRISRFYLPEANGGRLQLVRDVVAETIAQNLAAGLDVGTALRGLADGDAAMAAGDWKRAFDEYRQAYRTVTQGN